MAVAARDASASDARPSASDARTSPDRARADGGYEYEIALGSSGWLFIYYVGVVKAMRERGMASKTKVYGTSGGALSGALLFMDCDLDALAQYVYICAARARRSVLGAFQLRAYCRGAMTEFCDPRAHELLNGRFEVSITRIFPSWKNLRISQFPTYDFLITALLCSACIVPLSGLPIWLRGFGLCLDGAVTDMQVWKGFKPNGTFSKLHCKAANPNIVIVNPFYSSRADIKPSKYIPIWWCFYPPEPYKLKQLYEMGYADGIAWYERTHGGSRASTSPPSARVSDADVGSGSPTADQQRSWATDCQEWANQSAETAARRAAAAAESARRAAAKHAEEFGAFMKHEGDLVARMSFKAAEVASAAARSVNQMRSNEHTFAERADAAAHATLDAFVVVGKGTIIPFRLALKIIACLLVYCELVVQSTIALAGATMACVVSGGSRDGGELWRRCRAFSQPLPRVLLQAVPGVRIEAKINEKTAKQLGELSALYRLLCYLVHMNEREFDVLRKHLSQGALNELAERAS